jgi:hypothetical protein
MVVFVLGGLHLFGLRFEEIHKQKRARATYIRQIDQFFQGKFKGSGNVYIHFKNFIKVPEDRVYELFYRGTYNLYPRKVYISDKRDLLIEDAGTILKNNTVPTEEWLNENKIAFILTLEMADGKPRSQIRERNP